MVPCFRVHYIIANAVVCLLANVDILALKSGNFQMDPKSQSKHIIGRLFHYIGSIN